MTETVLSHADGDPGAYETLVLGIGNVLWAGLTRDSVFARRRRCTRGTRSRPTCA
jgi:hypothetical protein